MKPLNLFLIIFATLIAFAPIVHAEESNVQIINLSFNSAKHFKLDGNISRVFIGSSEIATAVQLSPSLNEFVVTGHGEGSTTLFIWTVDGTKYEYIINVTKEETAQATAIEKAIGLPDVHVKKVENRILLTGTVRNQYERNFAVQTARLYVGSGSGSSLSFGSTVNTSLTPQSSVSTSSSSTLAENNKVEEGGNVIDLLQMLQPTQIRLEAQIIAINPQDIKNLGIDYGGSDPSGSPGIFAAGESYAGVSFRNNPWRWLTERRANINLSIRALITQNRAKLLSRPSIMTMSGEEAVIHVGGKIPYITYVNNSSHTEWQQYGIILQLKPLVDADNRIVSAVHAEVSSISSENVQGYPIIEQRRADSVVTMNPGSTMIIGGLMDSSERKVVRKIPLIGDIPIIGEFFKYSSKRKDKQELIILVTPYLVDDYGSSYAGMSNQMRDYYHQGQREKYSLNDVDLNEPPPPEEPAKKKKVKQNDSNVNDSADAPFGEDDQHNQHQN